MENIMSISYVVSPMQVMCRYLRECSDQARYSCVNPLSVLSALRRSYTLGSHCSELRTLLRKRKPLSLKPSTGSGI